MIIAFRYENKPASFDTARRIIYCVGYAVPFNCAKAALKDAAMLALMEVRRVQARQFDAARFL